MLESHMKLLVLVLVAPLPVQLLQIFLGRGQRKVLSTWASVTYMGDLDGRELQAHGCSLGKSCV